MTSLRVGVCECPPELLPDSSAWDSFCRLVSRESPDLLLLNELPFGPWISSDATFDRRVWEGSRAAHERGVEVLGQLGVPVVAASRPLEEDGKRFNEGFMWTRAGLRGAHTKQYFPDEEGYFEARWFEAGERHFQLAQAGAARAGFLICTEVMFNEHARSYGRQGGHLILVPRAVGKESLQRWLVAMRMAAIVSGCYVLSSNRAGIDSRGQTFAGTGWIIDPSGNVLAETSSSAPLVCQTIDLQSVARAQAQYPCYVRE